MVACGGLGGVGLVLVILVLVHVLAWEAVKPFAIVLGVLWIVCIFINPVMSRDEYRRTGGRWGESKDRK